MTAATEVPTVMNPQFAIGPARLLCGAENGAVVDFGLHRQLHGQPTPLSLSQLIAACESVNLRGRGGAAFPVATKLAGLARGRCVVVVNATESEPASQKDRFLIEHCPHLILDGALLVADALDSHDVRIAVHDRYHATLLQSALADRPHLRRVRISFDVVGGGFVAGEARAVIRSLNGGPAIPPGRRTLPTQRGVGGAPTFLSNAETFAQLAVLASLGPDRYAQTGTSKEPGTTLVTVAGAVARPGVIEIPLGTPLSQVLTHSGAARAAGIAIGGYHGAWIPAHLNLPLSPAALAGHGATLGAGIVLVVDDTTCGLGELTRVAQWLAGESAGQCGPCQFGLPALVLDLIAINRGQPRGATDLHRHTAHISGRGACAHPDGAIRFITTGLAQLARDVDAHRHRGNCGRPIRAQLPLGSPR
jgi:NADH:ubiquinone oxidoreductase subunit F (NADH-binding)